MNRFNVIGNIYVIFTYKAFCNIDVYYVHDFSLNIILYIALEIYLLHYLTIYISDVALQSQAQTTKRVCWRLIINKCVAYYVLLHENVIIKMCAQDTFVSTSQ